MNAAGTGMLFPLSDASLCGKTAGRAGIFQTAGRCAAPLELLLRRLRPRSKGAGHGKQACRELRRGWGSIASRSGRVSSRRSIDGTAKRLNMGAGMGFPI
jgi:hypothetical protein